jgi:hypothetical protein
MSTSLVTLLRQIQLRARECELKASQTVSPEIRDSQTSAAKKLREDVIFHIQNFPGLTEEDIHEILKP